MAPKNKPYEQFGPYVLFRKLESDSLSELWRAARIEGNQLGALVALRRFTGGNRDAIAASVEAAREIAPLLNGTSFAKNQVMGVVDGMPFLAYDYSGGRSLKHIVEKARGGAGTQPNPIPLDQVVLIAEKIALSLATTADLRFGTTRLSHGALLPQFVWISDDGEIRVAGQQLAQGLLASLKDSRVAAEFGRYFAPESHATGVQSKAADIYATGAILFLLTTGIEPPDATTASAFTQSIRGAKTMAGGPIPDEIRAILDKSLNIDVAARYSSIAEMKQALSTLAGGKFSATTFNLAFYVSTLLKKELEGEGIDHEREMKVNVAPYVEALKPQVPHDAPSFASLEGPPRRSRAPLAIGAVVTLAVIGVGAFYMFRTQAPVQKVTGIECECRRLHRRTSEAGHRGAAARRCFARRIHHDGNGDDHCRPRRCRAEEGLRGRGRTEAAGRDDEAAGGLHEAAEATAVEAGARPGGDGYDSSDARPCPRPADRCR